jgi:hypothetical protein
MAQTVSQLFNEAAKKLKAEFEYIRTTNPHSGEKGADAEDVVRTFLNHHLPQRFRAAPGVIIDKSNNLSPQTDVIIYDALTSPVYRYSENLLILPLDMVAAVIEVKSTLNKKEITDGYKKIAACKRLKKTPLSPGDQQATGSDLRTVATYGAILGFSSDTSLATLAQHAEDLNKQYEPSAWPDLIAVLDAGTVHYGVQFPGASSMGHMMPPTDDNFVVPPMIVHLLLHEDGDFALNRFFILLLSHLTFFPRRIGTPTLDQILEGAAKTGVTLHAYQYTQDRKLTRVPDELYSHRANLAPVTISITSDNGALHGIIRYFPWIDGGVLAWSGDIPFPPLAALLGEIGLKMMSRHNGVEYSNPIKLTEAEFREWPERLNRSMKGLHAQMSGFVLGRGFNEGTSEPFIARMMASIFEMRDRAFVETRERQAFEASYGPILENLIEVRWLLRERTGITGSIRLERGVTEGEASPTNLMRAALIAISSLFGFFNLPDPHLIEADDAFNNAVAAVYAHDPDLATFLLGVRSEWLGNLAERLRGSSDVDRTESDSSQFQYIAGLAENVVVHMFSKRLGQLARSLTVMEIPIEKRDPNFQRRFAVVLATEPIKKWELRYKPGGFDKQ